MYLCHICSHCKLARGKELLRPKFSKSIRKSKKLLPYLVSNRVFHLEILYALRKTVSVQRQQRHLGYGREAQLPVLDFLPTFAPLFWSRVQWFKAYVCVFRDGLAMSLLCGFLGFIGCVPSHTLQF